MATEELVNRACPVCNKNSDKVFAPANFDFDALDDFAFASRKVPEYMHFRLLDCDNCDILYASPILPLERLHSFYKEADFDSGDESEYAARSYAQALVKILPRLDKRFAVDIGAGDGTFLAKLLDLGFDKVEGIEPSAKPIAAASEKVKSFLKQGFFAEGMYPANSLSLITCFQTIEHLATPLQFVKSAKEMLKSGGAVMLVGHNKNALSAKLLGTKSPIFDIEHLQLFSTTGLARLLSEAGFTSVRVTKFYNTYPLKYWCRLFPFPSAVKPQILNHLQSSTVGKLPISLSAGNLVAFGFKE